MGNKLALCTTENTSALPRSHKSSKHSKSERRLKTEKKGQDLGGIHIHLNLNMTKTGIERLSEGRALIPLNVTETMNSSIRSDRTTATIERHRRTHSLTSNKNKYKIRIRKQRRQHHHHQKENINHNNNTQNQNQNHSEDGNDRFKVAKMILL